MEPNMLESERIHRDYQFSPEADIKLTPLKERMEHTTKRDNHNHITIFAKLLRHCTYNDRLTETDRIYQAILWHQVDRLILKKKPV